MGKITRKRYSAEFKSKVAIEAIKGEQTLAELAATFSGKSESAPTASKAEVEKLHAKIGQLLVERDFLRDAAVRLGLIRGGK